MSFNRKMKSDKRLHLLAISTSLALFLVGWIVFMIPASINDADIALRKEIVDLATAIEPVIGNIHDKDNARYSDSVLLVNTSFDMELADYYMDDVDGVKPYLGKLPITNRKKIFDFLQLAKHCDNYKYILIDIPIENDIPHAYNDSLALIISSMRNVCVAINNNSSRINLLTQNNKYATVGFDYAYYVSNFSKFSLHHDSLLTAPLKMYSEISGHNIIRKGPFLLDNGRLASNLIYPHFYYVPYMDNGYERNGQFYRNGFYYNLGTDIVDVDDISDLSIFSNNIKNKIIILGNFSDKDENDMHNTYTGRMSGSLILYNIYLSLVKGEHLLSNYLFYAFLIFLYYLMMLRILYDIKLLKQLNLPDFVKDSPIIMFLLHLIGYGVFFYTIAIIMDLVFGVTFITWIPILFFTTTEKIIDIWEKRY